MNEINNVSGGGLINECMSQLKGATCIIEFEMLIFGHVRLP